MNVYDFDETIFRGDSEDRFFQFLFKKKGYFWYRINYNVTEFLFRCKLLRKTTARERDYLVLKKIDKVDDLHRLVEEYWDEVEQYLLPWYETVKKPDDVIASGTPYFIMAPIVKRLGLTGLVATDMDERTGKCNGKFAVAEGKLDAFLKQYKLSDIDNFYSDAYSDHFLADGAKHAYVVENCEKLVDWDEFFRLHPEKKVIPYRR